VGHLGLQRPLDDRFGHLIQQPVHAIDRVPDDCASANNLSITDGSNAPASRREASDSRSSILLS